MEERESALDEEIKNVHVRSTEPVSDVNTLLLNEKIFFFFKGEKV